MIENGIMNTDAAQKIRMCVRTFFNLYGYMPSTQDMINWLGVSYEPLIPEYLHDNNIISAA